MSYRYPVSRSHRIHIDQPAALVEQANALAEAAGHPLSSFVHAAIISAVRLAESGRGENLPKQQPRRRGVKRDGRIAITAPRENRVRWSAALESYGSSLPVVVSAALTAFVAAEGSWADTVMPGESVDAWRRSGAA